MAAVLEVAGLYKNFSIPGSRQKVQAVNGVSFALNKGETLALVGESGSGKTTVGRCVLGLEEPTRGRVLFKGEELSRKNNVRKPHLRGRIQLVFQEPAEVARSAHAHRGFDRGAAEGAGPAGRASAQGASRR